MVKLNAEDYQQDKLNYNVLGIDITSHLSKSRFINLESRNPKILKEPLWHTKEDYIAAVEYSRILYRQYTLNEISDHFITFIMKRLDEINFPTGVDSFLVDHDNDQYRLGLLNLN